MTAQPFLDPQQTHTLYATSHRLSRRTNALHAAKIRGRPVADVVTELTDDRVPATVVDIGCGRGSTTAHFAHHWHPERLIGIDRSPALLADAHRRLPPGVRAEFLCADFHALPLPARSVDLLVAAFCLYHTRHPGHVLTECARVLRPHARAVLVTKSPQSYRSLDEFVAFAGLDQDAAHRPSLYATFHSENAAVITGKHLTVDTVIHHEHEFCFHDPVHLAHYLTTTPKYALPSHDPFLLAEQLHPALGPYGLTTTSTVSYILAHRR